MRKLSSTFMYFKLGNYSSNQEINDPDIITICDLCEINISDSIRVITKDNDYCVCCFAKI